MRELDIPEHPIYLLIVLLHQPSFLLRLQSLLQKDLLLSLTLPFSHLRSEVHILFSYLLEVDLRRALLELGLFLVLLLGGDFLDMSANRTVRIRA